jgi:hypothetical protein
MNAATQRSIFRWIHLVFSIPIAGYIYSPFKEIPQYAPQVRFVFFPILVLSGLWMWQGHVLRRLLSKRPAYRDAAATAGRFPDQGTIHRWFQQATAEQAQAWRQHLHQVMKREGRFWQTLFSGGRVVVDLDAQGLAAHGARFEKAAYGHLGEGLDRGYQRFVAYAGQTREVLDEFLRPGNTMLTGELTELLNGLNEIFAAEDRPRRHSYRRSRRDLPQSQAVAGRRIWLFVSSAVPIGHPTDAGHGCHDPRSAVDAQRFPDHRILGCPRVDDLRPPAQTRSRSDTGDPLP